MSTEATKRVQALRQRRVEQGLVRVELYLHPDDREPVRKFARRLQRRRERQASEPSEG
jgi:NADPH-dependent ferric siderophore reductase